MAYSFSYLNDLKCVSVGRQGNLSISFKYNFTKSKFFNSDSPIIILLLIIISILYRTLKSNVFTFFNLAADRLCQAQPLSLRSFLVDVLFNGGFDGGLC